ncbi:MAG: radical SAM protein [Labilithrix sp.]|nr:radical SAM protein [Labilithrix sp.]
MRALATAPRRSPDGTAPAQDAKMLDRRALPIATPTTPLADALSRRTARGLLFERGPSDGSLRCTACAHRCTIGQDRRGACGVRFERDGVLRVPFGYVARAGVRLVEATTLHHVLPGARALAFGMYGCDLRCGYCQDWYVSQALRHGPIAGDARQRATARPEAPLDISAEALVSRAVAEGCGLVCAAYNEPAIAAEWVHEVFRLAKLRGLVTAMITDGNATRELLELLRPVTDVYRVDLKGYSEDQYRALGGRLAPVLASIALAKKLGYWVEVVTLVVPYFNDELPGLRSLAMAIARIDPDIPWHLRAFHPRYRMRDRPPMSAGLLVSAAGSAYAKGLRFVYVGHPDQDVGELAHTRCPSCREAIVRRRGHESMIETRDPSRCPRCATPIPGVWRVPRDFA